MAIVGKNNSILKRRKIMLILHIVAQRWFNHERDKKDNPISPILLFIMVCMILPTSIIDIPAARLEEFKVSTRPGISPILCGVKKPINNPMSTLLSACIKLIFWIFFINNCHLNVSIPQFKGSRISTKSRYRTDFQEKEKSACERS